MDTETTNLDDDWINKFESNDKLYKDFYKDDLYFINIRLIYVNRGDEIEKIKHETFLMSIQNYITRDEILGILKKNSIDNDRRYTLLSILKYNISINTEIDKIYKWVDESINCLKFRAILNYIEDIHQELKSLTPEDVKTQDGLMMELVYREKVKLVIADKLGRSIL